MTDSPRSWTLAVDFGTTATVAAIAAEGERPLILEMGGERRIPSVVFIDEDGTIVVGRAAAGLAVSRPDRAIRAPKSRLDDQVPLVLGGQPYRATTLVTSVLEAVLEEAVRHEGSRPTRTRLTYPATWNRPRRAKLLEAATRASMPDPVLIAEPVAAALTYAEAAAVPSGQFVAVYDLGGGTFDTAVLQSKTGGFRVVGRPLGDPQLGGELFDEMLMNLVGEKMDPDAWDEILVSDERPWRQAAARLRNECKRVKETLSNHGYGDVVVGLPTGSVEVRVTRSELEALVEPYIDESIDLLARCIADAGVDSSDLTSIYVTGGGSRMPLVETKLREAYPEVDISRRGDPKAAVAFGALVAAPESLDVALAGGAGPTEEETFKQETPSVPPSVPARPATASPPRPQTPSMPPKTMASQDRSLPAMPPASMASQDQALPPMPAAASQIQSQPAPQPTPLPDTVSMPLVTPDVSDDFNASNRFDASQQYAGPASSAQPQPVPIAAGQQPGTPPQTSTGSDESVFRNPIVLAASAVAALVLLGLLIVAVANSGGGGQSVGADGTGRSVSTTTTPTTLATTTTTAAQTTTTAPTTEAPPIDAGPSQADIDGVVLTAADFPSDWTSDVWVEDENTICDLPAANPALMAVSIHDDPATFDRIISLVNTYGDEQTSINSVSEDRNLINICPEDRFELNGGDEIDIKISEPNLAVPTLGDESYILQFDYFDLEGNLVVTAVFLETRWGRSIVQTSIAVTGSETGLSSEQEQRLRDFHDIAFARMIGIPR